MEGLENLLIQLPAMITGFAALGPAGWIAGGVLALLLGVGGFFLWRWLKKRKIREAEKKTTENRTAAEREIARENRTTELDAAQAERKIEKRGR